MKLLLALSLLLSLPAGAQTVFTSSQCGPNGERCGTGKAEIPPATVVAKPLSCGQYEHAEMRISVKDGHLRDECVDDVHIITEKQWKALADAIDLLKEMNLLEEEQIKLITGQKPSPREPKP